MRGNKLNTIMLRYPTCSFPNLFYTHFACNECQSKSQLWALNPTFSVGLLKFHYKIQCTAIIQFEFRNAWYLVSSRWQKAGWKIKRLRKLPNHVRLVLGHGGGGPVIGLGSDDCSVPPTFKRYQRTNHRPWRRRGGLPMFDCSWHLGWSAGHGSVAESTTT